MVIPLFLISSLHTVAGKSMEHKLFLHINCYFPTIEVGEMEQLIF